jgi:NADP-dependent 3-hydroxy acid dehydrogenase YdfG
MLQTIVITGCTKGIGLATAQTFAKLGFNIAGCARNLSSLKDLQLQLEQINPNGKHTLVPCDVSKSDDIENFTNIVLTSYKQIDILVNNAGLFLPAKLIDEKYDQLNLLLQTNVVSAYLITKRLLPAMLNQQKGHIFNICSIASLQGYPNGGSYTISKFALLGFSKQLRLELQPHHIRVTAVMPGATLTDSWNGTSLPKERFIAADDVAKTIRGIYELSSTTDVEEIIIRPQLGDI